MVREEEIVWRQIQQKDEQAFERYYKEHHEAFFLMACQYFPDDLQARAVVNDVFLTIWEKAATIRIETSLKSYIYKAIINHSLNLLKKEKREQQRLREGYTPPMHEPEDRQMEENEFRLRLFRAIDQLPEQRRKVFWMSRFEEMKYQEIADALGISVKTVKNHIGHALKQLRRLLTKRAMFWLFILPDIFFHAGIGRWAVFIV